MPRADLLASLVPLNQILYLFKVKDEGIMFYFGRSVVRLTDPGALPTSPEPLFCILTDEEWGHWNGPRVPPRWDRSECKMPKGTTSSWSALKWLHENFVRRTRKSGRWSQSDRPKIKSLVESNFTSIWITGEISSLTRAGSGHIYLSLKDPGALIRCVLWRSTALRTRLEIEEGMQVLVRGKISVYPPRGDYQLVIEEIQPHGLGAQDLALKKLREELAGLGYFAPQRKRPIPRFPAPHRLGDQPDRSSYS